MNIICNGRRYDTSTAKKLVYTDNGYAYGDFYYIQETLYRKRNGEYFLYVYGGAMTKYSTAYGNSYGSGEKIIPLTLEKAKSWVERKASGDKYESIFGKVDEESELITCKIAMDNYKKVLAVMEEEKLELDQALNHLINKC